VYLRNTDEPFGTLILDGVTGGNGITPLGLPGQTTFVIPDAVVIRGNRTNVRPEHGGLVLDFQRDLTIQSGGRLTVGSGEFEPRFAATVTTGGILDSSGSMTLNVPLNLISGGLVQVTGTLTSSLPLSVVGSTIATGLLVAPSVSVTSNGQLTSLKSTQTQMHKLEIDVSGTLSVDTSSRIDVSSLGYLHGRTTPNTTVGAATGNSGGSHGGRGGSNGGTTNALYGDFADPEDWGSGGSALGSLSGGDGGGLVRITAGRLLLNGPILANGQTVTNGSGGSGGGIYVAAGTLEGNAAIRAGGGSGNVNGGGGGRVAVYALDHSGFNLAGVTAPGGTGSTPGTAGTVHIVQGKPHTHVRSHTPAGLNGGYLDRGFDAVTLHTNKPLDLASFDPSKVTIQGPNGSITATAIVPAGDRLYRIDLPAQATNGNYRFVLSQTVLDAEGFELDQDADGIPGEPEDFYAWTLTIDTVGPRITNHEPAGDIAGTVNRLDVWFSERMDRTTFAPSDVIITRPGGQTVAVTNIQEVGLNRFRITFAPQTAVGPYQVRLGPDVRDLAGNRMDQAATTSSARRRTTCTMRRSIW
jgi:hypothetical protein